VIADAAVWWFADDVVVSILHGRCDAGWGRSENIAGNIEASCKPQLIHIVESFPIV
jgi:hypothetical protein